MKCADRWCPYLMAKRHLWLQIDGLALEKLETEWAAYPVLHLDLSGKAYNSPEDLDVTLEQHLKGWEATYGINPQYRQPETRFKRVNFDKSSRRIEEWKVV